MKKEKEAVLVCFSIKSEKFESHYERNKFFRSLYGWKQMIRKEVSVEKGKQKTQEKVYTYKRGGLLDEIPHMKVDQSSFIVEQDDFDRIMNFFKEWHDKVMWKNFKILLNENDIEEFLKEEDE